MINSGYLSIFKRVVYPFITSTLRTTHFVQLHRRTMSRLLPNRWNVVVFLYHYVKPESSVDSPIRFLAYVNVNTESRRRRSLAGPESFTPHFVGSVASHLDLVDDANNAHSIVSRNNIPQRDDFHLHMILCLRYSKSDSFLNTFSSVGGISQPLQTTASLTFMTNFTVLRQWYLLRAYRQENSRLFHLRWRLPSWRPRVYTNLLFASEDSLKLTPFYVLCIYPYAMRSSHIFVNQ